eukprot:TRINITY_DN9457_c0_g9_i1.p1 TRINITY_DN9457_c0_g9~~TRINITY_DN9457_c0_g9_i1.p1  ORF type:complete len:277 (+),score=87.76 TRINITY_DN9457_c0_g9_i1:87-917(+)
MPLGEGARASLLHDARQQAAAVLRHCRLAAQAEQQQQQQRAVPERLSALAACHRLVGIYQGHDAAVLQAVGDAVADADLVGALAGLAQNGDELCSLPLALLGYAVVTSKAARFQVTQHPADCCGICVGLLQSGDALASHDAIFLLSSLAEATEGEERRRAADALAAHPSCVPALSRVLQDPDRAPHRQPAMEILRLLHASEGGGDVLWRRWRTVCPAVSALLAREHELQPGERSALRRLRGELAALELVRDEGALAARQRAQRRLRRRSQPPVAAR